MALSSDISAVWLIFLSDCLCAKQPWTPLQYFGTKNRPEVALWGWTMWSSPEEGSLRPLVREQPLPVTVTLSFVSHQCQQLWWSAGQQIYLIFDVLAEGQLRNSFLDPQSGESSSRVGVPALSHQFSHHTQSLVGNKQTDEKRKRQSCSVSFLLCVT